MLKLLYLRLTGMLLFIYSDQMLYFSSALTWYGHEPNLRGKTCRPDLAGYNLKIRDFVGLAIYKVKLMEIYNLLIALHQLDSRAKNWEI